MHTTLFNDRRANGLLNRVREDVSHLRDDIGSLLNHTTRETLPRGARELADQAKHQLAAGGAYAASRLRHLRSQPPRDSASVIGGVVVVGLIAYGIYAILSKRCEARRIEEAARFEPDEEAAI